MFIGYICNGTLLGFLRLNILGVIIMRRTFALGIFMLLFLVLLTGCNEETQINNHGLTVIAESNRLAVEEANSLQGNTSIPSGGHFAPVELQFSSLENFITAHRAVNAEENIDNLVEFWRGRGSSATFTDTIERLEFASLERLYLPTGIPEAYQLFRITVFEDIVEFLYLPEAYLVSEYPTRTWIDRNRDFIFSFSRGREWDLAFLMRQNGLTEDDLIDNKYLLLMPNWLSWESAGGEILHLSIPQSIVVDSMADMARFAEITTVDLQNENVIVDTELIFDWVYTPQNPITRGCLHSYYDIPARSPQLYLNLNTGGLSTQNFRAAGGTTSWFLFYQASGSHPLNFWRETQRDIDFNAFIGQLENTGNGEIELLFSHFPPDTVYVRRWRAEFIGMVSEMGNIYEFVEVNDNIIRISNSGYDYIYEVEARWVRGDDIPIMGRAFYTFRINSAR